jgi:predicted enzyme related to lactoylglutathione lyase
MPRPVHFDISAEDPERATRFYGEVFDWKFNKWDGPMDYWLISTGQNGEPGIDGGLSKRSENSNGTMNTIGVSSVDDYLARITRAGGTITMAKMPIPGVGWFASAVDPEGNNFGIMQPDPQAA